MDGENVEGCREIIIINTWLSFPCYFGLDALQKFVEIQLAVLILQNVQGISSLMSVRKFVKVIDLPK
jgi:hypothetical protein